MGNVQIPVSLEHKGVSYKCKLTNVSGAGATEQWHLMDNRNYYCGRLRWSEFAKGWVFDPTPKTQEFAALADYFGDVVTAWYE